jgi:hypothetical protein
VNDKEYIVQDVFNAYESYRCGKGVKYNNQNGALTALGHFVKRRQVNKNKQTFVKLERTTKT